MLFLFSLYLLRLWISWPLSPLWIGKLNIILKSNILLCKPFVPCKYSIPSSLGKCNDISWFHYKWFDLVLKVRHTEKFLNFKRWYVIAVWWRCWGPNVHIISAYAHRLLCILHEREFPFILTDKLFFAIDLTTIDINWPYHGIGRHHDQEQTQRIRSSHGWPLTIELS